MTGRLYETDRAGEKWVFLNPETLLYLAAFADRGRAEAYGKRNGYRITDPERITIAKITESQPKEELVIPPSNSPIPDLGSPRKKATPAAAPTGRFARRGLGSRTT